MGERELLLNKVELASPGPPGPGVARHDCRCPLVHEILIASLCEVACMHFDKLSRVPTADLRLQQMIKGCLSELANCNR